MIRLIGIDVDGTLLDARGQIPQANIDAIHDAVRAGIHIALVTGRSYPFARPIADPLPSSIALIVSNGAVERGDGWIAARAAPARPRHCACRARVDEAVSARRCAGLRSRRGSPGDVRDDGLGTSGTEGVLGA